MININTDIPLVDQVLPEYSEPQRDENDQSILFFKGWVSNKDYEELVSYLPHRSENVNIETINLDELEQISEDRKVFINEEDKFVSGVLSKVTPIDPSKEAIFILASTIGEKNSPRSEKIKIDKLYHYSPAITEILHNREIDREAHWTVAYDIK